MGASLNVNIAEMALIKKKKCVTLLKVKFVFGGAILIFKGEVKIDHLLLL